MNEYTLDMNSENTSNPIHVENNRQLIPKKRGRKPKNKQETKTELSTLLDSILEIHQNNENKEEIQDITTTTFYEQKDNLSFSDILNLCINRYLDSLNSKNSEQLTQDNRSHLIQEQNDEYEKSLMVDKEKEKRKNEEMISIQKEKAIENEYIVYMEKKLQDLPKEPSQKSTDIVAIAIKTIDGYRIIRNFYKYDSLNFLYEICEVLLFKHMGIRARQKFELHKTFPNEKIPNSAKMIQEIIDENQTIYYIPIECA